MDVCYAFPGQGVPIDRTIMRDIYEKEGKPLFERANAALEFDITDMILDENKQHFLKKTEFAQPAILVCSIAGYQRMQRKGLNPEMVVGHSLGEYSALVAADVMPLEEAVRLVWTRGRLMSMCIPEKEKYDTKNHFMAAILNTEEKTVENVCLEIKELNEYGKSEIANINAPSQIVIAGNKPAISYASERFRQQGVKNKHIRGLNVEVPFHCSIMFPAEYEFIQHIEKVRFKRPKYKIFQTFSGRFEDDPEEMKYNVVRQISTRLNWHCGVDKIVESSRKICKFVEACSNVLTRLLIRRKKEKKDVDVIDNTEILDD